MFSSMKAIKKIKINVTTVTSTGVTRGRKCCLAGHLPAEVLKRISTILRTSAILCLDILEHLYWLPYWLS